MSCYYIFLFRSLFILGIQNLDILNIILEGMSEEPLYSNAAEELSHSIESYAPPTSSFSPESSIAEVLHGSIHRHSEETGEEFDPLFKDEEAMERTANLIYYIVLGTSNPVDNRSSTWFGLERSQQEDEASLFADGFIRRIVVGIPVEQHGIRRREHLLDG